MTFHLEYHFFCDRCDAEIWQPAQGVPLAQRLPENWLAITMPDDVLKHFCPGCAEDFERFLEEEK